MFGDTISARGVGDKRIRMGTREGICAMMKRFIEQMKRGIKRKEDSIERLQQRLQELSGQANADQVLIKQIRDEIRLISRKPQSAQRACRLTRGAAWT